MGIDGNAQAAPLETNGSIPGVNSENSRVIFHASNIRSKPEAPSPPGNNGSTSRDLQNEPLIPPTPVAEPTPVVIDDELDGDDLRLTITVKVNGRSIKVMNALFNRVIADGALGKHRHVFFQTLTNVLD